MGQGYVLLAVAAVLVLRPLVYKQVELTFINFAALPAVLMLHAVTVCFTVPKERQDGLITAYFKGWFVAPFVCIGRFFGAIGSAYGLPRCALRCLYMRMARCSLA